MGRPWFEEILNLSLDAIAGEGLGNDLIQIFYLLDFLQWIG